MSKKIKTAYKRSIKIYDDVLSKGKWWSKLYIDFFWDVDDLLIAQEILNTIPNDFSGKLLDVPCGTINFTYKKYIKLKNAQITCMDYSSDMISLAKKRIEENNLSNIKTIRGDVGNIPFADESFDILLSMNGFHAFPDKKSAFKEITRVLKPGGMLCGSFYIKGEHKRSDWMVNKILVPRGWFTPPFYTKDEVISHLKKHFKQVEVYNMNSIAWFNCIK